ncbi:MAG: PKD domain-containing protein [Methanomicrobiaceae archaeon]|nr:PKD domain-containing protein [Methanomicrobiaceae archaeon]
MDDLHKSIPSMALCLFIAVLLPIGTASAAPSAGFSVTPTSGTAPLIAQFTDQSTGDPDGRAWFFGDEAYDQAWTQVNGSAEWPGSEGHTSAAMPDGSVVLMGGFDGYNYNSDVWRSEDHGVTWTPVNVGPIWSARQWHTSVVMPDGSVILMGGCDDINYLHDVWRSADRGTTWDEVNPSALWTERYGHATVAIGDTIILMGGYDGDPTSDVWRSINGGENWTCVNAIAGWPARYHHTSVVTPNGDIILTGGLDDSRDPLNDVWRSEDGGATWILATASAGWAARSSHTSVAMPDGSIVLMGGKDADDTPLNDVWRSTNGGTTWTQLPSAGWTARGGHTSIAMPDGSILLMGGKGAGGVPPYRNDVWQLDPVGSRYQNPSHIYAAAGTYSVALQVYNNDGYDSIRETNYIAVTPSPAPEAAFVGTPTSGTAPLTVQFTDESTDSPTGWAWFFGDETYGETWTEQTGNAGWSERYSHTTVAMPDGSILLMGGGNISVYKNDTWRSTDDGETWTLVNGSSGWMARLSPTVVTIGDTIVLMGGQKDNTGTSLNDTWVSDDYGETWEEVNGSSGWMARRGHTTVAIGSSIVLMGGLDDTGDPLNDVWISDDGGATWALATGHAGWSARSSSMAVMIDSSIVLMGGWDGSRVNDVWRSADGGATWTLATGHAGWEARCDHTAVAMPDGSILLMGGSAGNNDVGYYNKNDVWRSTDDGATWTQLPNAGWAVRHSHTSVAMPNGSVILMGGWDAGTYLNDVWRLDPVGSPEQNPSHEYAVAGTYSVALQVFNDDGYSSTRTTGYITVEAPVAPTAAFSADRTSGPAPLTVQFTDASTDIPTGWAWFFGDETYAEPWTEVNAGAGWTAREAHTAVAMPDGGILLMGGIGDTYLNDVWRSTDSGATWEEVATIGPIWSARTGHTSVAMPDGSIILMGGLDGFAIVNDTWRSTDGGATWTLATEHAAWPARYGHSSVVLPDGDIILTGGWDDMGADTLFNDVWRSTDDGATWMQQTGNAGWTARTYHSSVVMPDGSIVLMGGYDGSFKNDVWRSTDGGATWTQQTGNAGWGARAIHGSVAMPDGSILLMGGQDAGGYLNDMWRSTDYGATWTRLNASAGWTARRSHTAVEVPDGSVVLFGGKSGSSYMNDVWRLGPVGSSEQNPSHEYAAAGTYSVALQASNAAGYGSTREINYITVTSWDVPTAAFNGTPTSGTAPLIVSFTDTSAGSPMAWNWSFGDGEWFNTTSAAQKSPTHTYASAGNYTVNLTVVNLGGADTHSEAGYITVTAPTPTPTPTPGPIHDSGGDGPTVTPVQTPTTIEMSVGGNSPVSRVIVAGTGIGGLTVTGTVESLPGIVYKYFSLVPARYTTITAATITFTVPAAWLEEHGLSADEIVLYHYNGAAWTALPTTVGATENGQITFTATSPGFSLFAICGVEKTGGVTTPTAAQTTARAVAQPTAEQTTAAPAGDPAPDLPLGTIAIVGGAALVLAAGGCMIRRWWIRRQNPALFMDYD